MSRPNSVTIEVTKSGDAKPIHAKLGPDYADLKKDEFHWHYEGDEPEKQLIKWLQDLFGESSVTINVVSHETGLVCFSQAFSLHRFDSVFRCTRFLARLNEGKRSDPPNCSDWQLTDGITNS